MKRRLLSGLLACAAIGLAAVFAGLGHRDDARAAPPAASAQAGPGVRLSAEQWASLDIRRVGMASFPTRVVADAVVAVDDDATVPVFSPTGGQVLAVKATVGEFVRAGQALATIAGTESAQAVSDLAAATAQARTAHQQLDLARATAARQRGLIDAGGGATKDLLQSQSDLVVAEGAASTADAALQAARVKVDAMGLSSIPATASRPRGANTGAGIGATTLAAPVAGQVIQRQVAPGQFIASLAAGAATPLFTISDLHKLWVVASVDESQAAQVRIGQAARVTLMDGAAAPIEARVAWIAPAVDPASHRLSVRLDVANPDLVLKPQMSARVRLLDERAPQAVAVPDAAVIFDGDQAHCFVVAADHTLVARPLKLGRREGGSTPVLSGLAVGDQVVVHGAIFVDAVAEGAAP